MDRPEDGTAQMEAPTIVEVSPEDARREQQVARQGTTDRPKADKLLTVRNLSTHFFTPDGVVQAVDDVTLRARLR